MKLASLVMAIPLMAAPGLARSQALPAAKGPGAYAAVGGGYAVFHSDYGQRKIGGMTAWAELHPAWRYALQGEVRVLRHHTDEGVRQSSYLAGPMVYLRSHRVRPYAKVLAGAGRIQFPFGYGEGTYFAYAPGAGVDVLWRDWLSVRAVDFEWQQWPKFTFGKLAPYGVSAGIVIRLTPMRRYPRH